MKVGDLVKVKYNGRVGLITNIINFRISTNNDMRTWVRLFGEDFAFKKEKLEAISGKG